MGTQTAMPDLVEITDLARNKTFTLQHNLDRSKLYTIYNRSGQHALVVVTMNAGSGDINESMETIGNGRWINVSDIDRRLELRSIAGRRGNDIQLFYNNTLKCTASGGSGSIAGVLRQTDYHWNSFWTDGSGKKHYRGWHYGRTTMHNYHRIAREGEQIVAPLIVFNNDCIKINFVDNGARGNIFKGSVFFSLLYYVKG